MLCRQSNAVSISVCAGFASRPKIAAKLSRSSDISLLPTLDGVDAESIRQCQTLPPRKATNKICGEAFKTELAANVRQISKLDRNKVDSVLGNFSLTIHMFTLTRMPYIVYTENLNTLNVLYSSQ